MGCARFVQCVVTVGCDKLAEVSLPAPTMTTATRRHTTMRLAPVFLRLSP